MLSGAWDWTRSAGALATDGTAVAGRENAAAPALVVPPAAVLPAAVLPAAVRVVTAAAGADAEAAGSAAEAAAVRVNAAAMAVSGTSLPRRADQAVRRRADLRGLGSIALLVGRGAAARRITRFGLSSQRGFAHYAMLSRRVLT